MTIHADPRPTDSHRRPRPVPRRRIRPDARGVAPTRRPPRRRRARRRAARSARGPGPGHRRTAAAAQRGAAWDGARSRGRRRRGRADRLLGAGRDAAGGGHPRRRRVAAGPDGAAPASASAPAPAASPVPAPAAPESAATDPGVVSAAQLEQQLAGGIGLPAGAVFCPSALPARAGASEVCRARMPSGGSVSVVVSVTSVRGDDVDLHYDLAPAGT